MKKCSFLLTIILLHFFAPAQTFTMGKKCKAKNDKGMSLLKEKSFAAALDTFILMEKSCTTKDAKEAIGVGKAEAYNGLGKYTEAIAASDAALKVTKNQSLNGFFQKAVAQNKLKQYDAANKSFSQVIALTEKNKNTKARAANYATLGLLHWRQMGNKDSAAYYLEKAMALDPANANFVVQKGDMLLDEKAYDDAFVHYDKAVSMGKTDLQMYEVRTEGRMKMMQDKYKTNNTQELRSKMSANEKEQLCSELKKAISLGLNDMKQEMFASLVCK